VKVPVFTDTCNCCFVKSSLAEDGVIFVFPSENAVFCCPPWLCQPGLNVDLTSLGPLTVASNLLKVKLRLPLPCLSPVSAAITLHAYFLQRTSQP